jgi:hypothetical protein
VAFLAASLGAMPVKYYKEALEIFERIGASDGVNQTKETIFNLQQTLYQRRKNHKLSELILDYSFNIDRPKMRKSMDEIVCCKTLKE